MSCQTLHLEAGCLSSKEVANARVKKAAISGEIAPCPAPSTSQGSSSLIRKPSCYRTLRQTGSGRGTACTCRTARKTFGLASGRQHLAEHLVTTYVGLTRSHVLAPLVQTFICCHISPLQFSGHLILETVLDSLDARGLVNATEIVLTGESAGGIGVWPNLDWLAKRYPMARGVGAPIAGFYFYAVPYTGLGHTSSSLADFRESAWAGHVELWNSTVDESCAAVIEPWRCLLANESFPFITSSAFIIEAQSDKVVLGAHDWVPVSQDPNWSAPVEKYLVQWSHNMSVALAPSMDLTHPNGVFSPACFVHTDHWETTMLDGLNYVSAFSRWFFDGASIKLQDSCGLLCNPTCPH